MMFQNSRLAVVALTFATLSSLQPALAAGPTGEPEARRSNKSHWMVDGVAATIRLALKFRYRVSMGGLDEVRAKTQPGQGTLFLPSHPGYIDPFILVSNLWPDFRPRPIIAEEALDLVPGLRALMVKANALVVPKIESKGDNRREAVTKLRETMDYIKREIVEGLARGENFVMYPAGTIKTEKREKLGSTSMAFDLVQETRAKNSRIVLVQMNGIWGSSFSRAATGAKPVIKDVMANAAKTVVKNGVFFIPKRDVSISMFEAPASLLEIREKRTFNRELEDLLNSGNIEHLDVPYDLGSGEPGIIQTQD